MSYETISHDRVIPLLLRYARMFLPPEFADRIREWRGDDPAPGTVGLIWENVAPETNFVLPIDVPVRFPDGEIADIRTARDDVRGQIWKAAGWHLMAGKWVPVDKSDHHFHPPLDLYTTERKWSPHRMPSRGEQPA